MFIKVCDCMRGGTAIRGEPYKRVVEDKDGYCVYCGHHTFSKKVPEDWKPSEGIKKTYTQRVQHKFNYIISNKEVKWKSQKVQVEKLLSSGAN